VGGGAAPLQVEVTTMSSAYGNPNTDARSTLLPGDSVTEVHVTSLMQRHVCCLFAVSLLTAGPVDGRTLQRVKED
jgi:hypothetical protein